jgi:acetone carboxylase gamma subunit
MCGEAMRLTAGQVAERVPGAPQTAIATAREWVCPECDYFEDAENVGDSES